MLNTIFAQQKSRIIPVELTCEYLTNPTGLDVQQPRFSWKFVTSDEEAKGQKQSAFRILVSNRQELLNKNKGDLWDSGWNQSDNMQLIEYRGEKLTSDRSYFWKVLVRDENNVVSESEKATFTTGLFSQNEWDANWIGTSDKYIYSSEGNNIYDPWLRKTFDLKGVSKKANLFVASVGYHEVYVNGQKIGKHVLAPAVSDHTKRARYITYDIAPALKPGKNVIAIWLGTSWSIFAPYSTPDKPRTPIVIAQADIYDKNNSKLMRIVTDHTWKTHPSPNKLVGNWGFGLPGGYGGEIYDESKEIYGWNFDNFDDQSWNDASIYNPSLELSAQQAETNALFNEINPVSIQQISNRIFRVDMGVNFAGWTQIKIKGEPNDTIHFMFSEREQEEMTFGIKNAYVLGKSGEGVFQNRFNYSSGRWITIKGLTETPKVEDIKGWMVRTDFEETSSFECSDELQNWIYHTVKWTFENLSLGGYVVDCPQRERFGYGGDAHATSETGMLNYKLGAFYTKWLEDWRDVQGTEPMVGNMNDPDWARKHETSGRILGGGILPQTAPTYHGGGGPAWGGIVVTLPWFLYEYYKDIRALEVNFEMIKGWLEFLDTHTVDNMLQRYGGRWDFLGDWLWPHATEHGMNNYSDENLFFNNCYWVYNLKTAAKIARIIGQTEMANQWEKQANTASETIHNRYFHPEEFNYSDKSMRSLAAALYGDIMPSTIRPEVMKMLEHEILVNQNGHIDVGITGGAMLFKVLRDEGRDDLILSMTSQTTYPSWGFMQKNNATTIWEMWEKDLPGHSLLHSSYLYPGAWYIDGLAGIKREDNTPGFQKIIIRVPNLPQDQISWAKAEFNSPAGLIKTHWKRKDGKTQLNVTVPPNCSATIYFPDKDGKIIHEKTGSAKAIGKSGNHSLFEITSGSYQFEN